MHSNPKGFPSCRKALPVGFQSARTCRRYPMSVAPSAMPDANSRTMDVAAATLPRNRGAVKPWPRWRRAPQAAPTTVAMVPAVKLDTRRAWTA